jgi:hypothetical protein
MTRESMANEYMTAQSVRREVRSVTIAGLSNLGSPVKD